MSIYAKQYLKKKKNSSTYFKAYLHTQKKCLAAEDVLVKLFYSVFTGQAQVGNYRLDK